MRFGSFAFAAVGSLVWAGACGDFDRAIGSYTPELDDAPSAGGSGGVPPSDGGSAGAAGALATALYFEAEEGELSGDWLIGEASAASGGEYIESAVNVVDPAAPGTGVARYEFEVETLGDYVVWGRTHGPEPSMNRYFVRIDGGEWIPWRISTGDVFWWDDLHRDAEYGTPLLFLLAPGTHTLEMGNSQTGAQLDRLYITGRGDEPPGNTGPCGPPHSIEVSGACVRACGTYGNTSCGAVECAGRDLMPVHDCDICCVLD